MKPLFTILFFLSFICIVQAQNSSTYCTKVWMDKNLNVDTYRNGDKIPQVTDPNEWANLTTGAWCWYNNDSARDNKYGKLYNWYAITDPRGIAPQGWHIPSDAEWATSMTCNDGKYIGILGINASYRNIKGEFLRIVSDTFWWSSSEDSGLPVVYYMNISQDRKRINSDKGNGFSILCIKD